MVHSPFTYVLLGGLAIALLYAAATDFRSRTIANGLTGGIALAAPLYWWASGLSPWPDIAIQLGLAAATFVVCCIFFALRQMGGGDVKLLTALALWVAPSQFAYLLVIMAMSGWVLTLAMGAWGVAHSRLEGRKPWRDAALLAVFGLIAANFASAVLGGPKLALPAAVVGSLADSPLLLAMLPIGILAVVTLGSVHIIRSHHQHPRVPYGLAISFAGLWVVGAALLPTLGAA